MTSPRLAAAAASTRTESEVRASRLTRGRDWKPAPGVSFEPVPFKLLRVKARGADEIVFGDDMGDYNGHLFDPWKRGDLVVVERACSYWETGKGTRRYTEWSVGTRHTTPSAPVLKVSLGGSPYAVSRADTLWRIPYCYQRAAALLIGQAFETREALEAAI
jgi:hypothetical protein